MAQNIVRRVDQVIKSIKTVEGGSFPVARAFPAANLEYFDPFLMVDHFGPIKHKPGAAKGAPWHPHRGFQTVTYMLQGESQHQDSLGNKGFLRAGDVQWMTAGSGIIHDEQPSDALKKHGGVMEGFQIWVNLPKKDKMCDPEYQDYSRDKIPVFQPEDSKGLFDVRVIAGSAYGLQGAVQTPHGTNCLDFWAKKGASISCDLPSNHNILVFLYRGAADFKSGGDESVKPAVQDDCVVYQLDGESTRIEIEVTRDDTKFLLLSGVPLNEPVAHHGPFVMNTREEITQAIRDYHNDNFVKVKGTMKSKAEHATEYRPDAADAKIV